MKIKRGILKEEEEFLDYLSRKNPNEEARKEENLKKKFGEEKYKRIYSFIGGRKTGAMPKKDDKGMILYINDEGLKFLEECQKEKNKRIIVVINMAITFLLMVITFIYMLQTIKLNSITYDSFEASNRPYFYIKPFSNEGMKMDVNTNTIQLNATIMNIGNTPGRLLKVLIIQNGIERYQSVDLVTLSSNKERAITVVQQNIESKNNITVKIIYTGIGKLSHEYSFSRHVYINEIGCGTFLIENEEGEMY